MEKILLLHGALGNKNDFKKIEESLVNHLHVYSINFSGHDSTQAVLPDLSIEKLAMQVVSWMEQQKIDSIHLFGYSMGGYVALYLARHYPTKVKKIVTLGTKFNWNQEEANQQIRFLNPSKMLEKVPQFAEKLASVYGDDKWKIIVNSTAHLMQQLGKNHLSDNDFELIQHPTLLCIGSQDIMVTEEETQRVHSLLKNSKILILANTRHPIEEVSIDYLASTLLSFI